MCVCLCICKCVCMCVCVRMFAFLCVFVCERVHTCAILRAGNPIGKCECSFM